MSPRLRTATLGFLVAALVALPAGAGTYHVELLNGTAFETRYQPKEAAWDPSMIVFSSETGNVVALPKSLVAAITSEAESRGFGRVIDTTTVDMGILPNDMPTEAERAAAEARAGSDALTQFLSRSYDMEQFVEPDEVGGGIPVWGAGFGGGVPSPSTAPFLPPPPPIPAPAPAPVPIDDGGE
ncbi:MAG TPA: hypothetical protein VMT16_09875 [Thermoanaerobaculia bacterium]|nr:hypothetical protein [Thermoanaerobaculia bacterium]